MPKPGRTLGRTPEKATKAPLNPLDSDILIPARIVESLLITQSNSNRVGVAAVCQQIREAAQKQLPEVFPG